MRYNKFIRTYNLLSEHCHNLLVCLRYNDGAKDIIATDILSVYTFDGTCFIDTFGKSTKVTLKTLVKYINQSIKKRKLNNPTFNPKITFAIDFYGPLFKVSGMTVGHKFIYINLKARKNQSY